MKLTIVRHGETIENANNIIQGQMPGTLSELGKLQVKTTAEKLKDGLFDVIYCSDLQRCLDTLEPIKAFHPGVQVIITPDLRERGSGEYQGKVMDEPYWQSLPGTNMTRSFPGGESWQDVKVRIGPFLNDLYSKYPDKHILLITHGGVVRAILSYLENRELSDVFNDPMPNAEVWEKTMTQLVSL